LDWLLSNRNELGLLGDRLQRGPATDIGAVPSGYWTSSASGAAAETPADA